MPRAEALGVGAEGGGGRRGGAVGVAGGREGGGAGAQMAMSYGNSEAVAGLQAQHQDPAAAAAKKKRERPDKFVRQGRILALAAQPLEVATAPDEGHMERLLSVVRLAFMATADLLRVGDGMGDIPRPIIGEHYIGRRDLGPCMGGSLSLQVQEICTFDEKSQVAHQPRWPKEELRATMTVAIRPWARTQGKLILNNVTLELNLEGGAVVQLDRHREEYQIRFPALRFTQPLDPAETTCDYFGQAEITCPENRLEARIEFRSNSAVRGTIVRHRRPAQEASTFTALTNELKGPKVLAMLRGRWDRQVLVTQRRHPKGGFTPGEEALLFDASTGYPKHLKINKHLDVTRIGPVQLPRMWTAFHDALMSIDPRRCSNSSAARDLAKGLRTQLPRFFGLRYDERVPVKPRQAASESESEDEVPPMGGETAATEKDLWRMPDLFESEKELGKRLQYQLSYTLLFKPEASTKDSESTASDSGRASGGAGPAAAASDGNVPCDARSGDGEEGNTAARAEQQGVVPLPAGAPAPVEAPGTPSPAAEDDIAPARIISFESYSTDEEC